VVKNQHFLHLALLYLEKMLFYTDRMNIKTAINNKLRIETPATKSYRN